jgi:hypothetical protein
MKKVLYVTLLLIVVNWGNQLKSQISEGGIPPSFAQNELSSYFQEIAITAPTQDELYEDVNYEDKINLPHRFAKLLPVNLNPENSGTWETQKNGDRIWRLGIYAENALSLCLYFNDFYLPKGYKLFLYDGDKKLVKGAFTDRNNQESRLFATESIKGDYLTIELYRPEGITENPVLNISDVAYAYKNGENITGFGGSDYCEINAACSPEGIGWQVIKKSVVRIKAKVGGGLYWCSGVLVNNTYYNGVPYLLTANHCAYHGGYASPDDVNQWLFYFNYESEGCENPGSESEVDFTTMVGATKIANASGDIGSDFYLVRLNNDIPQDVYPYFSGWSASGIPSNSGVTIHHPEGDIKKISTYNAPLVHSSWSGNGVSSHWRVYWVETQNNWGVTEGGSSGSPLFDDEGRLVGTLTGGQAACGPGSQNLPDYYGAFFYHWQSNGTADTMQLKPWLDPTNTGITVLNGFYVGVKESPEVNQGFFDVYPNPVNDKLFVKFNNFDFSIVHIEIFNIFGKNLFTSEQRITATEIAIDTKSLKPGIYFVRISNQQHSSVERIVKK